MNHDVERIAARAAPVIFVVLWSTGFIGTKYVINNADPLTYLAIRMAVVVGLMTIIVAIARPKWPDRIGIAHSAVAGILRQPPELSHRTDVFPAPVAAVVMANGAFALLLNRRPHGRSISACAASCGRAWW